MIDASNSRHPRDAANFVSKVTLWWIFPLLWKGYQKPLNHEDLYPVREVEKSEWRTKLLEEKWGEEVLHAQNHGRNPKLWRALLRYYTWQEYFYFLPFCLCAIVGVNLKCYGTITLLYRLISFNNGTLEEYFVYVYAIALGCFLYQIGQNIVCLCGVELGVRAHAAVLGLLYKKALCRSMFSLDSGQLMELVSNDSQRLFMSGERFILFIIKILLVTVSMLAWLVYFVGWSCIGSVLFLLLLSSSRLMLNGFDYQLRKEASQLSAKRLGLIRETLTALYTVKLNCLETIYEDKIQLTRWQEVKAKAKRWMIMLTTFSFASCGQHVATFIAVLVLSLSQAENIAKINFFALLYTLRTLTDSLCMALPNSILEITNMRSALVRIEMFLQHCDKLHFELDPKSSPQLEIKTFGVQLKTVSKKNSDPSNLELHQRKSPSLYLNIVSCKLPTQDLHIAHSQSNFMEILTDITIQRDTPGLVLICGPVGSGKTSLLATILGGELELTNGSVKCTGTLAYVSDTPWVFPGTVRENILFHLPYNEKLYHEVIRACQLERDLNSFPSKDLARIGEHGGTLSGGQRTRIALARAIYSQADMYLLDDPLSSLDAKVAENIFRQCIQGLLSGKIVLLTTHNSRYFKEADEIIYMRGGRIKEFKVEALKSEMLLQESVRHDEDLTEDSDDECYDNNEENNERTISQDDEEQRTGRVAFKVYKEYFTYGAWAIVCFIVTMVYLSGQGMAILVDYKASRLSEAANWKNGSTSEHTFLVYTLCLIAAILLLVVGTLSLFLVLLNAAYKIHNEMVMSVVKAPLSFHASHAVGQILNRFSQDINILDELLPISIFWSSVFGVRGLATIILAVMTTRVLIIPILISIPMYYFIPKIYFTSSSDIKRLMSIAGSPIYSHFSNTVNGLRNIRVYGRQKEFTDKVFRHIDEHHRAVLCSYIVDRCFANILTAVNIMLSTTIMIVAVNFVTDSTTAALGAVTILYAVNLTNFFDYAIRVLGQVNSQMTSAERVLEYTKIQPESGQNSPKKPPQNWPNKGEIVAKNVSLWHYQGGPLALKNITFKVNASEKIGIAGRTGAGKSSLIAALMRLSETRGEILIDGLNINDFNTPSTRKCFSVISQSPTLINGSIRLNVDPLGEHTDAEIWNALHRTKMSSAVKNMPKALDSELSQGNSNLSIGEKQMLNLARVLLQNNKIVIFDEATGKVDENTDKEIQRIVNEEFQECTIITVSHRLDTILNCDRVMVLDQGEIKEFDNVSALLNKTGGLLRQLKEGARKTQE